MRTISFFSFFLLYLSFTVQSQIVNVEKKRKDANGFQATVGIDFNIKETGNRIMQLTNTVDIQYALNAHNFILLNSVNFMDVDGGSLINNGYQHLRYNYTLKDSSFFTFETFGQHQYNELKLLTRRIVAGAGPRFRILNKENVTWFIAPLAMFEFEELSDSLNTQIKLVRLDSYTSFNLSLGDAVSFNLIAYYQPDFGNFNDYRVSGETGLTFNVTNHFSYAVKYAVDFDSQPPEDIQNTFWYLTNKLIFKF